MMNSRLYKRLTCAASVAAHSLGAGAGAGGDDDGGIAETRRFEVLIENVTPEFTFLKSSKISPETARVRISL